VLKKIVIVAERAAGAGLTEDAGFPMMKNRRNHSPRRHGGTEKIKFSVFFFSVALCLRGEMTLYYAHCVS
jgi:hypothetical protein